MEFKTVKTYGRFRNRVIKTDLWISPGQVERNNLFQVSRTSSESSNTSSVDRSQQDFIAISDESERANKSSSSGKTSKIICPEEESFKSLSNDSYNSQNLSQPSSLSKNNNSPVVEHSTPFSSSVPVRRPRRLPVLLSPLIVSKSPLNPAVGQDSDINLFSDSNQEHDCNSPVNEVNSCNIDWTEELNDLSSKSEKSSGTRTSLELQVNLQKLSSDDIQNISDKMKKILSLNESPSFTSSVNSDESPVVHDSVDSGCAKRTGSDIEITSIEDSLSSTQNISSEDHPTDDFNDKNQSENVCDISEKKQNSLTESEIMNQSTIGQNSFCKNVKDVSIKEINIKNVTSRKKVVRHNHNENYTIDHSTILFDHDLSNGSECEGNSQLQEPLDLALHADVCNSNFSREKPSQCNPVLSDNMHGHLTSNKDSYSESSSNGPLECTKSNDTSRDRKDPTTREQSQSFENFSDIGGESRGHSIENLSGQGQNISNSSQSISSMNDSATAANSHEGMNHISRKRRSNVLQDECELGDVNPISTHEPSPDTKPVHSEKQATSMDAISKKLKELRLLDAKVYLNKEEGLRRSGPGTVTNHSKISISKKSLDDANISPSGDLHPPTHSENDPQPLPSSGAHPYVPPAGNGVPLQIPDNLDKNGFAEEVTPKNTDVHTPLSGQLTGKIKNPNFSSFVKALTPARFQQKRPLSPKQKILMQCEQEKPLKFSDVLSPSMLGKCIKVGEGTYGEVYKTNDGVEDVALKVIPVEGNFTVNAEPQKSFEEMIPEIVISKELSNLADCDDVENAEHVCSNFIKVKRVILVQDSYPKKLLHEWDKWRDNHTCENERPDMYESDQYFVVFEFLDGGEDLERFTFTSMDEAISVLQQVLLSLSVAEKSLMFEHRDLHWGNVLIKRSECKTIRYKLHGQDIIVKSAGVFVSIIDFTLSRLTKDGITVFCDLSKDPDIFKGKGDYQFQVYRLMRKENDDEWESYNPYSNVLWMHYLVAKILNAKKYKKANDCLQRYIKTYLRQMRSYESTVQAVEDGFLGINVSKL